MISTGFCANLKGNLDFGLFLPKSQDLSLHGFSDSDWAGDLPTVAPLVVTLSFLVRVLSHENLPSNEPLLVLPQKLNIVLLLPLLLNSLGFNLSFRKLASLALRLHRFFATMLVRLILLLIRFSILG